MPDGFRPAPAPFSGFPHSESSPIQHSWCFGNQTDGLKGSLAQWMAGGTGDIAKNWKEARAACPWLPRPGCCWAVRLPLCLSLGLSLSLSTQEHTWAMATWGFKPSTRHYCIFMCDIYQIISWAAPKSPLLLRTLQAPVLLQFLSPLVLAKKWKWGQLASVGAECEGSSVCLQS